MRSVLQSLPTTVTVMVLVAIFLGVACLGVWRGARRDPQDVSRLDNIASTTLSLAMAGFTLVGSFAAYSLWNAETTRTALLGTELAAARAMLTEAATPGTTDPEPLRAIILAYATTLEGIYREGELASADMHGYDMMLDLSKSVRALLPANPTTASQKALENDYEALVTAHDERTSQTRPLLPESVFSALLAMAIAASYVAGRYPVGGSRDLKVTQVAASILVISALMSVVVILDSPATAAQRSLPPLQAFIASLQAKG